MKEGVLIACDLNQEWMLPWWWHHYIRHNAFPVAFVDIGMTESGRSWCAQRGELLTLEESFDFLSTKEEISEDLAQGWMQSYQGDIWAPRQSWYRKPFAMAKTPFENTIWVDLDCEIVGSLKPLFSKVHPYSGMALAREVSFQGEERGYNAGVIVYRRDSILLKQWMEACVHFNHAFLSDQDVLSFVIESDQIEILELPLEYNWRMKHGVSLDAVIIHWAGLWGKDVIRRLVQKKPQLYAV